MAARRLGRAGQPTATIPFCEGAPTPPRREGKGARLAQLTMSVWPAFVPKLEVVFFEANGLRHGEFDLRLTEAEICSFGAHVSLYWNCDSSILSVVLLDRVQLWMMGNYHYYLKQEFRITAATLKWHPSDPYQLCIFNSELIRSLTLEFVLPDCRA